MFPFRPFVLGSTWFVVVSLLLPGTKAVLAVDTPPPLYALLVGGGPDVESNAAQIEGHVHFVAATLPPDAKRVVLFADGKTDRASVSYAETGDSADAQRALAVLLADHEVEESVLTRTPELGVPLDGPARPPDFHRALDKLSTQAAKQSASLLLYFAGHGTQGEKKVQDTAYDLWDNDQLKVRALADELMHIPRQVPIVLVMAQCFSGAFADLLFAHGDPAAAPVEQNFVGFFSASKDREASGCSYATERGDYQDFSSYFFGALCGQDRFGGKVEGADYDGDGRVSLHEALCYALIYDQSADTPTCTSDVFLHRLAYQPDEIVFVTTYREAWQAGTPAQRAVLDALSKRLGLDGESRALTVFDRLTYGDPAASLPLLKNQSAAKERLDAVRESSLEPLLTRWPVLRWKEHDTDDYGRAFDGAVEELAKDEKLRRTLLETERAHEMADEAVDNEEAALTRFASVYEHIVEARSMREHGKAEIKVQFERLWKSEQKTLPLKAPR